MSLGKIKTLKLNFKGNGVKSPEIEVLCQYLRNLQNLKFLDIDIGENFIENKGVEIFSDMFLEFGNLKELSFQVSQDNCYGVSGA